MENHPQPAEVVYRSPFKKNCRNHALVLDAVGIRYEIRQLDGEFVLVVAASNAPRAREELQAYALENPERPINVAPIAHRGNGWAGVAGYVVVLVLMAVLDRQDVFDLNWHDAGKTQAGLIQQGQWWRCVTALTLHADLLHMGGNIIFGGLFGLFACQILGSGLAWLSILMAGAMGNLVNAWIRVPDHSSVGASTAVFAALGIIAAYAWTRRRNTHTNKLRRWAPIVGGVVLLSFLGTSGIRTDVTAHVAGFLTGIFLGAVYGALGSRVMYKTGIQLLLGMVAIAMIALSWALAFTPQSS